MQRKNRLLLLVHCYHNRAGVEEHVKVLSNGLRDAYDIFLTFPEQGALQLLCPDGKTLQFPAAQIPLLAPYRSEPMEQALRKVFEAVLPDLIHIVHFVNWPLGVIDQALATGKPVVGSFHDYYSVTPHYTMQGLSDPSVTTSAPYAVKTFGKDVSDYLVKRRAVLSKSIAQMRARAVPSTYLERQLTSVFSVNFDVINYGITPFLVNRVPNEKKLPRFGFLGSLLPQKGWESLMAGFAQVHAKYPEAALSMHGGFPAQGKAFPGATFFGAYTQESIPKILSTIDVGIIPSVFAETFSLVLSELWQGGVTAAVADIGAMGERVIDGVNGKKFKPGDAGSIAAALLWFIEHEEWRAWQIPKPPLADEMCKRYQDFYERALKG